MCTDLCWAARERGPGPPCLPQGADAWSNSAGIGPSDGEGGGSVWLKRAFSMLDREDLEVDLSQLDSIAKVGLGWLTELPCPHSACHSPHQAASARVEGHLRAWWAAELLPAFCPAGMTACAAAALPAT